MEFRNSGTQELQNTKLNIDKANHEAMLILDLSRFVSKKGSERERKKSEGKPWKRGQVVGKEEEGDLHGCPCESYTLLLLTAI